MVGDGAEKPKRSRSLSGVSDEILAETALWLNAEATKPAAVDKKTRAQCIRACFEPIKIMRDSGRSWAQVCEALAKSPARIQAEPSTVRNAFEAERKLRHGVDGRRRRRAKATAAVAE